MTIISFVILVFLVLLLIWIFVKLAAMPGQKAIERGHPQAEAINILGWIGLLLGIAPWLVALVWAYTKPVTKDSVSVAADSPAQGSSDAATETG